MTPDPTISHEIRVGDQTFRVRIRVEEKPFYEEAAKFTDEAFREICDQAVTGGPQAWAMAAFQMACELTEDKEQSQALQTHQTRIESLIKRIERVSTEP